MISLAFKITLGAAVSLLAVCPPVIAAGKKTTEKRAQVERNAFDAKKVYTYPFKSDPIYAWVGHAWDTNDKLFQQITNSINSKIANGKNPVDIARKYEPAAEKAQFDAPTVYRFAYASYRAEQYDALYARSVDASLAHGMLPGLPLPYNYLVARLRFLMEAQGFPEPYLKVVGERLLQRNPNDYRVEYMLETLLDPSLSEAEKVRAFYYAKDLIHRYPAKPEVYGACAKNYYITWLATKNPTDAKYAIALYQKYLSIAPPHDPFRQQANLLMKTMQSRLSTQIPKT